MMALRCLLAAAAAAAAASQDAETASSSSPLKNKLRRELSEAAVHRHMQENQLTEDKVAGLDLFEVAKLVSSDALKEFGAEEGGVGVERALELWEASALFDYYVAFRAETSYYLQEPGIALSDILYPWLLCSEVPGESALQRKDDIFDVVEAKMGDWEIDISVDFLFQDHVDALQTVYNTDDQTCFFGLMRASVVAVVAFLDNVKVIPLNSYVKHRSGVVDAVLRKAYPENYENSTTEAAAADDEGGHGVSMGNFADDDHVKADDTSLDLVLCAGVPDEELDRLGTKIEEFMRKKNPDGRSAVASLSPYVNATDAEMANLPERVEFWRKVFELGIDSARGCDDMLSRLETTVIKSERPGEVLGASIRMKDSEDDEEDTDTTAACVLGLIAAASLLPQICSIELTQDNELFNQEATWITQGGTLSKQETPFWDEGITGKGQVVAVSDTGVDADNCYFWDAVNPLRTNGGYDMARRKIVQYDAFVDGTDEAGGHGTHVAGTILGHKAADGKTETDGMADGVARDAKLAFLDCSGGGPGLSIPSDKNRLLGTGWEGGARLHSASWGSILNPYRYDTQARDIDAWIAGRWDMLMLVAAGNSGRTDIAESLGSPAVAKNVLAVGASQSEDGDITLSQKGMDYIADFSSEGPTSDGRIAPQIVAPGQSILSMNADPSTTGECDPLFTPSGGGGTFGGLTFKQGTSMATPATAGAAALVRQYFVDGFYPSGAKNATAKIDPSGTLVKAVILNGGQVMTAKDNGFSTTPSAMYDNVQGFGRVSLIDSLRLQGQNSINARVVDRVEVEDQQTKGYRVMVNTTVCTGKEMRATLVWADPPGVAGCTRCLVNDLDLTVVNDQTGKTYYPNGRSNKDSVNNVERVIVPAGEMLDGETWTANVRAANLDRAKQQFSLVMTGCFSFEGQGDIGSARPSAARAVGGWAAAAIALLTSTYFLAFEFGRVF